MIENLANVIDGDARNRDMPARDACLSANAAGNTKCMLKQSVQHGPCRRLLLRRLVGVAHLLCDLSFADNQAVEAGNHPEKMPHGVRVPEVIKMRLQLSDRRLVKFR